MFCYMSLLDSICINIHCLSFACRFRQSYPYMHTYMGKAYDHEYDVAAVSKLPRNSSQVPPRHTRDQAELRNFCFYLSSTALNFTMCLPIIFGCPTKIKPEGDQTPRMCPRCNNASVISAKSRMWFELFWIPLVPLSSNHIWICTVCQWEVPHQEGYQPAVPGQGFPPGRQQQPQGMQLPAQGYGAGK